ncbi:toxin-antitoxin system, toxin component family protein [Streptomyces thermodiastaticus]|jgi:hypothetical protein|uniref:toxin-antitoxin system, toxin component family protein n=1 Tax=Streptomyces thermodiastaticus TaxID=44061 RepID=UPI001672BFCE|nr:toxin-antitoxin system, toxin component family protein [Streptomyces thermodiastaticus]MCE7548744.1 toxin-antitoxin system, toxin component family protein [Streptomyces thermodiastaticus]GHF72426.1 hypothetical protein GCM10018787_21310 [Streptomyces thermodiastaticus]
MDFAGAGRRASRLVPAVLRRARQGAARRALAASLAAAVGARLGPPAGVREVCGALCEEMSARRGGRPVRLRFERFPDELEVTGLCVEFQDFDLVIVEERAEELQQLVILGHELWHLQAGHRHHRVPGAAAEHVLAGQPGWRDRALTMAARDGSREADEAVADDFGHRLAAAVRSCLGPAAPVGARVPDRVQRTLGCLRRPGAAR